MDCATYKTAKEVFETGLPARFNPGNFQNDHSSYVFKVKDIGSWLVEITIDSQNGNCSVTGPITDDGHDGPVHAIITIAEQDLLDLVNGKENVQLLFMSGKLRIEGDLPSIMKLVSFFPANA